MLREYQPGVKGSSRGQAAASKVGLVVQTNFAFTEETDISGEDEIDTNKVHLYALSKGIRGDQIAKDLNSAKRSNLSLGSLGPRGAKP